MAKITDDTKYPAAGSLDGTEKVALIQGDQLKKAPVSAIAAKAIPVHREYATEGDRDDAQSTMKNGDTCTIIGQGRQVTMSFWGVPTYPGATYLINPYDLANLITIGFGESIYSYGDIYIATDGFTDAEQVASAIVNELTAFGGFASVALQSSTVVIVTYPPGVPTAAEYDDGGCDLNVAFNGSGNQGTFLVVDVDSGEPTNAFKEIPPTPPFNQSLNTTDSPTFRVVHTATGVEIGGSTTPNPGLSVIGTNQPALIFVHPNGRGIQVLMNDGYNQSASFINNNSYGMGYYLFMTLNVALNKIGLANNSVSIDNAGLMTITGAISGLFQITTSGSVSGTVTFNASKKHETIYLSSASTITSITAALPTVTLVGQMVRLMSKSAITTLTISGTVAAGATLTSMTAGQCAVYQATNTTGTFIRIQ